MDLDRDALDKASAQIPQNADDISVRVPHPPVPPPKYVPIAE
jgi:hypothetical protein